MTENTKKAAGELNSLRQAMARSETHSNKNPTTVSDLLSGAAGRKNMSLIGLGANSTMGGAMWGPGPASGNAAAFGLASGQGGHGPPVSFMGIHNQASRVVLLIDHSGSMIGKLHLVKAQIRLTMAHLMPFQRFAVISFAHRYKFLGPDRLLAGTKRNKRLVNGMLHSVLADGHNDEELRPFLDPFIAAFKLKPQVIYFLTDGHFDKRLVGRVAEMARQTGAQVDTFAFLDRDPLFVRHLREIADATHGRFVYVSRRRLASLH